MPEMQLITKILRAKRGLIILMGLMVAAYVLALHASDVESTKLSAEIIEEVEQPGDEESKEPVVQILSLQMLPGVAFELEPFEAFFIRKLFVETTEPLPFIAAVPLEDTHHFKTLFRQIQSPNAP